MFNDNDEYFARLERVAARKLREIVEKDAADARQVASDKKKKDKKDKAGCRAGSDLHSIRARTAVNWRDLGLLKVELDFFR